MKWGFHTPTYRNSQSIECPLWVISGHTAAPSRMSAFGGKADVIQGVAECPLIAKSGHWHVYNRAYITATTRPRLSMFPEAPSSTIIGLSLRGHLGNIGSYVQDRLSSARLSIQEGRKRAAAADNVAPLPEMPGAVRKRLVGRARVPKMQEKARLARRRRRRHGVVGSAVRRL